MKKLSKLSAIVSIASASLCAQSPTPVRAPGYMTSAQSASVLSIVPPAPATGDPRFDADMAIFRSTRSLEGSPRWKLALSDDNLAVAGLLKAFSCALKLNLSPEIAPKLAALIARAESDAGSAANVIKVHYQHKRPFQIAAGNVCLSPQGKAALERSPDYPSGHTSISWDIGLILAELAPADASSVLTRAREFGQSRVVCGVHNLSAVEAGWMTATAVFTMQSDSPEFRKDFEAAKAELEALRTGGQATPSGCEAEAGALSKSPY